jgi:hypothetical protein
MVSAAGGEPLTEAKETSAMSNTRSVPAYQYPSLSISYLKIAVLELLSTRSSASNIATAVAD